MQTAIPRLESVQISVDGALGTLTLNRPETLNAFNLELMQDIIEAAQWFDRQPDIKVVIFSGQGRSFCSGFDMSYFSSLASSEQVREIVALGHRLAQTVSRMRATTIAAVHGHCVGGGVVLMVACDFRYATPDASFLLPETQLGIPLAWGGIPWLVREIGPLMTTEFVLLCDWMHAEQAHKLGMLNAVIDADKLQEHAHNVAARLCERSQLVLEATKQQVTAARDELASNSYSFCDAHLLHSALLDKESAQTRADYVEHTMARKPVESV